MKKCTKCGAKKSGKEFGKSGLRHWCRGCYNTYHMQWYRNNKKKCQALSNKNNREIKKEVIKHYGNKCACCKEKILEFLTIDHINGGGTKHRKGIGNKQGKGFYYWLRRNNYPKGFQVLCFNCNCGRSINKGICPHKRRL